MDAPGTGIAPRALGRGLIVAEGVAVPFALLRAVESLGGDPPHPTLARAAALAFLAGAAAATAGAARLARGGDPRLVAAGIAAIGLAGVPLAYGLDQLLPLALPLVAAVELALVGSVNHHHHHGGSP